eukprot:3211011-Pyramimonas_sp.AAC.1
MSASKMPRLYVTKRTKSVVISGDFNVELPGNADGDFKGIWYAITGGGVDGRMVHSEEGSKIRERERIKNGMRRRILGLLMGFGLKAASTFQYRSVTWTGCARGRVPAGSAVLDYMCMPLRWEIAEMTVSYEFHRGGRLATSRLSDHAMLALSARGHGSPDRFWNACYRPRVQLVGYSPSTWYDENIARKQCDEMMERIFGFDSDDDGDDRGLKITPN